MILSLSLNQNIKKILTLNLNAKFFKTLDLRITNILILNQSINKFLNHRLNYFKKKP
jgi:hypothetical protein